MIKTLRFERQGARFQLPTVTVPLNQGWTLKEAGHRAIVDFGEVRINGSSLTDEKLQKALRAVVFAAAAFNDAHEEYDQLVRAETEKNALKIFSADSDSRSDMFSRRTLEQATNRLELLYAMACELFLALYQGRQPEDSAFSCLGALAETFVQGDERRDVFLQ